MWNISNQLSRQIMRQDPDALRTLSRHVAQRSDVILRLAQHLRLQPRFPADEHGYCTCPTGLTAPHPAGHPLFEEASRTLREVEDCLRMVSWNLEFSTQRLDGTYEPVVYDLSHYEGLPPTAAETRAKIINAISTFRA